MKNREFERIINSEDNKNGEYTYETLKKFLMEKNKSIGFLSKFNFIKKLIFKKGKTINEVITDNLDTILSRTTNDDLLKTIKLLAMDSDTKDYVKDNIIQILERTVFSSNSTFRLHKLQDIFALIEELYGTENMQKTRYMFLDKNIYTILDSINKADLLEQAQSLIGISKSIDITVNKKIEDNKNAVVENMIRRMKQDYIDTNEIENVIHEYRDDICALIKKYMAIENVRWIDIKKIPKNSRHNDIYQIGSKVLKLGGIRKKQEIPPCARVMQPIESQQLFNRSKPYAIAEIMDKMDRLEKSDLEGAGIYDGYGEDIYQLYKELKKSNIIWVDAPHSLGFKKGAEKTLQNMLILDTDSLYNCKDTENLKKKIWSEYSMQFEERWTRERNEKLAKLHRETEVKKEEELSQ